MFKKTIYHSLNVYCVLSESIDINSYFDKIKLDISINDDRTSITDGKTRYKAKMFFEKNKLEGLEGLISKKLFIKNKDHFQLLSVPAEIIPNGLYCEICGTSGPHLHAEDCVDPNLNNLVLTPQGIQKYVEYLRQTKQLSHSQYINDLVKDADTGRDVIIKFNELSKKLHEYKNPFPNTITMTFSKNNKSTSIRLSSNSFTLINTQPENVDIICNKVSKQIKYKIVKSMVGLVDFKNPIISKKFINYITQLDKVIKDPESESQYEMEYSGSERTQLHFSKVNDICKFNVQIFDKSLQIQVSYIIDNQDISSDLDIFELVSDPNYLVSRIDQLKKLLLHLFENYARAMSNEEIYLNIENEYIPIETMISTVPYKHKNFFNKNGSLNSKLIDKKCYIFDATSMKWNYSKQYTIQGQSPTNLNNIIISSDSDSFEINYKYIQIISKSDNSINRDNSQPDPFSFRGLCNNTSFYINPLGTRSINDNRYYPNCEDFDKDFFTRYILYGLSPEEIEEYDIQSTMVDDYPLEKYTGTLTLDNTLDDISIKSKSIKVGSEVLASIDNVYRYVTILKKENNGLRKYEKENIYIVSDSSNNTFKITTSNLHPIYRETRNFEGLKNLFKTEGEIKNFLFDCSKEFHNFVKPEINLPLVSADFPHRLKNILPFTTKTLRRLSEEVFVATIIPIKSMYCALINDNGQTYIRDKFKRVYKYYEYLDLFSDSKSVSGYLGLDSYDFFPIEYQNNVKLENMGPVDNVYAGIFDYISEYLSIKNKSLDDVIIIFTNKSNTEFYKWTPFDFISKTFVLKVSEVFQNTVKFHDFTDSYFKIKNAKINQCLRVKLIFSRKTFNLINVHYYETVDESEYLGPQVTKMLVDNILNFFEPSYFEKNRFKEHGFNRPVEILIEPSIKF